MAANKVTLNTPEGEQTLIDLTADTATPATVFEGETFHGADGTEKTGAFTLNAEIAEQNSLIDQIKAALAGKTIGTLPEGYVKPAGELEITENGSYDVAAYARVSVAVAGAAPADPREDYQRVEYITSAEEGTYPYIITDFYGDNESGMEIVASFPVLQDRVPMGSREDSGTTRFYCVYPLSGSSIYYGFNTGASVSCQLKVDTVYRLQTNFLNSRLVNAYGEGGDRKGGTSLSGTLTQQTAPVSIFGYHSAASGAIFSKREYKLYSARCSQGHEVVREYIPVRRKSDGAVGLFEKFSGTFWGNDGPDGSAFAAGPDIDW